MDKISKVKQSLQGMLKRMTQEKEGNTNQDVGNKRSFQKQTLVKTKSLIEDVDPPKLKLNRRAVSVGDRRRRKTQLDKPFDTIDNTITPAEEKTPERNLIQFSSEEEGATSPESTPQPEDNYKQKLQPSPFSPRKHWTKAQEKRVHFTQKPELSNIKMSAPNSLQPPPSEGHCVAQYRSAKR